MTVSDHWRNAALWIIAAEGLILLPHLLHLPFWAVGASLLAMAWAARCIALHRPLPGRSLLIPLTLLAIGLTLWQFQTLNGRDPGVTLLALMLGLKTLELRGPRDAMVALLLGYFLIATQFFFDQSLPLVLWMFAMVWLLTAVLIRLADPLSALGTQASFRLAGGILLRALPIMLLLFLLFPRLPGPLWGLPVTDDAATTGLGEEMAPGEIARLVRSDAPAFRVRFLGEAPPAEQRYWRGPVLVEFDGRHWRRMDAAPPAYAGLLQETPDSRRHAYDLWPVSPSRWITPLELPDSLPAGLETNGLLEFRIPSGQARNHWRFRSISGYRLEGSLAPAFRNAYLQLPSDAAPRTRRLAHQWRLLAGNDDQVVIGLALRHFREQPFHYTLQPPRIPGDPVDGFLFETRRGFCEHYAGSFAVLMRAAGIPARVVTGYQGGELNPLGGYLLVRQSDAHAWVEVWLEGRGWVRIDPTAAVAPDRIELGLAPALAGEPEAMPVLLRGRYGQGVLNRLRLAWDSLGWFWDAWVLGFGPDRQRELLARLGLGHIGLRGMILLLTAGVSGLILLWLYLALRRDRQPATTLDRCRVALHAWLNREGCPPRPGEGPEALQRRIRHEHPRLAARIGPFIERYARLRFGPDCGERDARALLSDIRRARRRTGP